MFKYEHILKLDKQQMFKSKSSKKNFDICTISLRKNHVNLEPSFSVEHMGLIEKLFSYCKRELNPFFYLHNFICCV